MKWVLRIFALLDLIGFVYSFNFALIQINSLLSNQPQTGGQFFTKIIFVLLWFSLMASAISLIIPKKIGIIIYYFQLLPRLLFLVLSFGFISYLSYVFKWQDAEKFLMPIIIFAEMLRTYYSYLISQKLFRK
ncbi:MAG: hypothetical protein IE931_01015 [Sphingobacteriales bacterium]|nr:hypothetical protein [Sphingobacteriales bacterium]